MASQSRRRSEHGRTFIKVCGVTSIDDAKACFDEGVSAIGVNLVPASARYVDLPTAAAITSAVHGEGRVVVAVVANGVAAELHALLEELPFDFLQLHGDEPPALLDSLLPRAFKAIRVGSIDDIDHALSYRGDRILVDALVPGVLGGTGVRVDPTLIAPLARARPVIVAGGLTPENVGDVIKSIAPFGVDVASGVERSDDRRRKDRARVRAFVDAVERGR